MKFDHVGVTTADLETGRTLMERAVGVRAWTQPFEDVVNDVWVQFGEDASGICYELVAPLSERSPIRQALSKKINVLNHVAYLVDDLAARERIIIAAGFVPVAPARPAIAYGNRPIQFFVSRSRLLIEFIEAPDHRHSYSICLDGR
jgi:methylmalonyl-CoA/ethylmalonyl-CoA epimerase